MKKKNTKFGFVLNNKHEPALWPRVEGQSEGDMSAVVERTAQSSALWNLS